jgi:glycosyltransferase involved in cell wall biosynthesis
LGEIWGEKLIEVIESSSITIVPSIWNEVSPYVILESYRCGTPVLVSNSGGSSDIVSIGSTGEVFNNLDSLNMLSQIDYILSRYNNYTLDNFLDFSYLSDRVTTIRQYIEGKADTFVDIIKFMRIIRNGALNGPSAL